MRVTADRPRRASARPLIASLPAPVVERSRQMSAPWCRRPVFAAEPRPSQGFWRRPTSALGRPAALLRTCREELARLQDRLAQAGHSPEALAALEQRTGALAARVGGLSALRGHLVSIILG